jgi:CO/xanthine dehydrogenase Mo-binding subunit
VSPRLVKSEAVVEGRTEERWSLVEDDHTPEYPDGPSPAPIGVAARRLTAHARLTGSARYTSDIQLPGMLRAAILRSPFANARLTAIDATAARAVPGVRAVLIPADGFGPGGSSVLTEAPAYAGAPVAAVAADDNDALAAGLAALAPEYEELPFVAGIDEALGRQDFTADPSEYERGDPDAGMREAAASVSLELRAPAQMHNCMESHCAVAAWQGDELTMWISTQGMFAIQAELADAFDLDLERVRVICEYMGGGFGSKDQAGAEGLLAAGLARITSRPVSVVLSRREENLDAGYRAPAQFTLEVGGAADGTLTAIDASAVIGMGRGGWTPPALEPVKSVYRCANVRAAVLPVRQNIGSPRAFRAPGVMEGVWALENAIDELAAALDIDPLELRRRNHADGDQATGRPYSSKNLLACYDRAAELAGWADRGSLRSDGGRIRRGMGCASQIWWGGGGPPAYAEARIGKDGRPVLSVGMQDLGTGTITACAIIAAERLGVPVEDVRVHAGDTRLAGHGPFSGGSMTLASMAPAVRAAAHEVREQLLALASDRFEIAAGDLTLEEGEIRSVDGTLREPLTEVTGKLANAWIRGGGSRGPNPSGIAVNTFGCQIAQVAVDTVTGMVSVERVVAVHDVGRIVNPMGARSQVMGGILQGIGFALTEERVVDPTTGTSVNPGLEDYKVPTIADLPEVVCEFVNVPDPRLPTGVRGLGEPPIVPTPGAIGNALAQALGVRLHEAPYTPRRVLEALGG